MTVIALPCAYCGQPIYLTDTASVWRSDGKPHRVYHADCYKEGNRP